MPGIDITTGSWLLTNVKARTVLTDQNAAAAGLSGK
jgi:hypothetical protein